MRCLRALAALILAASANATSVNLIQNGDFEAGLNGWTVVTTVFGTPGACSQPFALQTTGVNSCGATLPNPVGGGSAVYSSARFDAGSAFGEFVYDVRQVLDVPVGITSATLTWKVTSAVQFTGSAQPSVVSFISLNNVGAVSGNVTCGVPISSSMPWTDLSCGIDILPILLAHAGQQLEIRLEHNPFVDPASNILSVTSSVGFDNVALLVNVVPEPATLALAGSALAIFFLYMRRKQQG